jgi:hypothetical protein
MLFNIQFLSIQVHFYFLIYFIEFFNFLFLFFQSQTNKINFFTCLTVIIIDFLLTIFIFLLQILRFIFHFKFLNVKNLFQNYLFFIIFIIINFIFLKDTKIIILLIILFRENPQY